MDFCMPRQIQLKKNGKVLIERIDFPPTVTASLSDKGTAILYNEKNKTWSLLYAVQS